MFSFQEQFSAATKSNIEAQIALLTALTNKAVESAEKVIDLNLNLAKASIEESAVHVQQLLSAKDPQEFVLLSATQAQPGAQKMFSYSRHLATIASSAHAEFSKATDAQVTETSRKLIALAEEFGKSAPLSAENAVTFVKSAVSTANASYEQLSKTAKQTVEMFENNLDLAAAQFAQTVANGNAFRRK